MLNTKSGSIKAMIIDDEVIAVRNLKNIIEQNWNDKIEVIATVTSTTTAEKLIRELNPTVVFLDIELRNENAFQFLERIKHFSFDIIFVTAYDEYALKALKLNAMDYILKPICIEELGIAIEKLQNKYLGDGFETKEHYRTFGTQFLNRDYAEKIVLKNSTSLKIVLLKDLIFLEAKRSYSCFHFMENGLHKTMLISKPMSDFLDYLPERSFYRIHKSYILNGSFVSGLCLRGDQHWVELKDGTKLPFSRRKYSALQEFLKMPEQ
ncbi:MAG: LytTR family DNA-binding domain-containing protein [Chitinophagaceae bacterium]|jgi:two-component system LytT family response regulator